MILIGDYTCPRSINEKSHLGLAKYYRLCFARIVVLQIRSTFRAEVAHVQGDHSYLREL